MTLIYIDTNIYLDYLLKRKAHTNFSKHAFNIFKRAISCEFHIVVSDHLLYELRKHVEAEKAQILFILIKKKIIKIETEDIDKLKAKELDTDYADALHIILAKKTNAKLIITRNLKDFQHLFNSKLPEDV
ncbi:PIN domain-containing protein [Candidatus Woesearchaeota archaeon]|nr:PIN domain-containing protein [Candidatus Woesearchaeota archaeon]